jgi:hypothetical protein
MCSVSSWIRLEPVNALHWSDLFWTAHWQQGQVWLQRCRAGIITAQTICTGAVMRRTSTIRSEFEFPSSTLHTAKALRSPSRDQPSVQGEHGALIRRRGLQLSRHPPRPSSGSTSCWRQGWITLLLATADTAYGIARRVEDERWRACTLHTFIRVMCALVLLRLEPDQYIDDTGNTEIQRFSKRVRENGGCFREQPGISLYVCIVCSMRDWIRLEPIRTVYRYAQCTFGTGTRTISLSTWATISRKSGA